MNADHYLKMISQLKRPSGRVDVVLDTDAYNEVDDQFAIAYLLQSPDKVNLQAIYAAPFYDRTRSFYNYKSSSAKEGMERSYQEIQTILKLANRDDLCDAVFRGAEDFMIAADQPQDSPAARDLIRRALNHNPENPLYVIGIGAPTNIASALLLEPRIAENIVVIWLGGNALDWPTCREFNLSQDLSASRFLFGNTIPLVQVPCMGVASSFAVTPQELKQFLVGKNPLCDYLAKTVLEAMNDPECQRCWSRILWDVTACAWLLGEHLVADRFEKKPIPTEDGFYSFGACQVPMRYVYYINRDALMNDMIAKLANPI